MKRGCHYTGAATRCCTSTSTAICHQNGGLELSVGSGIYALSDTSNIYAAVFFQFIYLPSVYPSNHLIESQNPPVSSRRQHFLASQCRA